MPAAIIAPIVGGALAAGGAVLASSNNSKAIQKSTDSSLAAQQASIAAQERMANQSLAFQQNALNQSLGFQTNAFNTSGKTQTDIYNNNVDTFSPLIHQGYGATNQIDALLGIPGVGNPSGPQKLAFTPIAAPTPAPATTVPTTPPAYNPNLNTAGLAIPAYAFGTPPGGHRGGPALVGENGPEVVNLPPGAQVTPNAFGNRRGGWFNQGPNQGHIQTGAPPPAATPTPTATNTSPQQQALNAFYGTQFYQFPLQQGLNAVNSNYAARGLLQSGAAQKSLEGYASGVASGAFGDYLQALGSQQALGANAGSNLAGLGSNYANSLSGLSGGYANALTGLNSNFANNATGILSGLGNAQGQYATNVGNIYGNQAINSANNSNGLINGLGNIAGGLAGYFAASPYSGSNIYSTLSPYAQQNMYANPGIF